MPQCITFYVFLICSPSNIAFTPDGKHAYVTNSGVDGGGNTISVIDVKTHSVIATILVGDNPSIIAFTFDGKFAYVLGG
ncbi:hypothetical protein [Cytobacillus sp. IB215665]|uniref:YncE family protein n=1 Tax=Cytobacillus sp. IB215665 TaxID=3097357 RepID=UPI002A172EA9|nr:hypothetical protein [Cytobacillus sp. IB215665]MDX8366220.1 hypothetical protein [Cytobacillus sp. IB215665]